MGEILHPGYHQGPAWQVACRPQEEVFNYIDILLPPLGGGKQVIGQRLGQGQQAPGKPGKKHEKYWNWHSKDKDKQGNEKWHKKSIKERRWKPYIKYIEKTCLCLFLRI